MAIVAFNGDGVIAQMAHTAARKDFSQTPAELSQKAFRAAHRDLGPRASDEDIWLYVTCYVSERTAIKIFRQHTKTLRDPTMLFKSAEVIMDTTAHTLGLGAEWRSAHQE